MQIIFSVLFWGAFVFAIFLLFENDSDVEEYKNVNPRWQQQEKSTPQQNPQTELKTYIDPDYEDMANSV